MVILTVIKKHEISLSINSETCSANTTVETADATNEMVDITAQFIMKTMDTSKHLLLCWIVTATIIG